MLPYIWTIRFSLMQSLNSHVTAMTKQLLDQVFLICEIMKV